MKKFFRFSFVVNGVILMKYFWIIVGGSEWEGMDPDSGDVSNSSTASTATSPFDWDELKSAIDEFIREYELRHQAVVETESELRRTSKFEAGVGPMYQAFLLKFIAYQKNKQAVQSSVIVKVPQRGKKRLREERLSHYAKERYMYDFVLPVIHSFIWPGYETLAPDFYVFTKSKTLIIENLRESRFYTAEYAQMSWSGYVQVFKFLARFHALSVPFLERKGSTSLHFLTTPDGEERFKSGLGDAAVMYEKFTEYVKPHLTTDMRKNFEKMISKVYAVIENGYSPNESGFNVIIHGDPNRTNVFLRNDEGNDVQTCKFIDFQYSRLGSPAVDLVNYLISSVPFEIFKERGGTLVEEYLEEFQRTMQALDHHHQMEYDIRDLRTDLRTYKMYFLYKLTFNAPLFWTPSSVVGSAAEEDNYDLLWKSDRVVSDYKKWMEVILSW